MNIKKSSQAHKIVSWTASEVHQNGNKQTKKRNPAKCIWLIWVLCVHRKEKNYWICIIINRTVIIWSAVCLRRPKSKSESIKKLSDSYAVTNEMHGVNLSSCCSVSNTNQVTSTMNIYFSAFLQCGTLQSWPNSAVKWCEFHVNRARHSPLWHQRESLFYPLPAQSHWESSLSVNSAPIAGECGRGEEQGTETPLVLVAADSFSLLLVYIAPSC